MQNLTQNLAWPKMRIFYNLTRGAYLRLWIFPNFAGTVKKTGENFALEYISYNWIFKMFSSFPEYFRLDLFGFEKNCS